MAALSAMEKLHSMVATAALHDGKRDDDDYTGECLPGTREMYLQRLTDWADNGPSEKRVDWVNAVAGAGKTALTRSFCAVLEKKRTFAFASFFVWTNDASRNNLDRFPATIAAQLCERIPALAPFVETAINHGPFLFKSTFQKQIDNLVIAPLLDACEAVKKQGHIIIIVDGLDELDAKGQTDFFRFIPHFIGQLSSLPISLLVTSRPETEIVGAFQHPNLSSITIPIALGESEEDIWKFLNEKLDNINLRFPYLQQRYGMWPSKEQRAIMFRQSSGLFIWPTVAINYIDKTAKGLRHNERLELVLSTSEPKPWVGSPLDKLYWAILNAHAPEDRTSIEFLLFKRRLALLCLPVDVRHFIFEKEGLEKLLVNLSDLPIRAVFEETLDEVWDSVADFTSIFKPREPPSDENSPLPTISHRTFRDFTFNRLRCGDEFYYRDEQELHSEVICKFIDFFNSPPPYKVRLIMQVFCQC